MAWRSEKKTGVAPALHAAFMATSYCAESEDGALQLALMVGVSDATLDALLAREGQERWAYLTAWNPGARQGSDEDNARRNRALFLDLLKAGARPILSGRGIPEQPSEWPPEASYLAVGLDVATARQLGQRYGQVAVLVGRRGGVPELLYLDAAPPQPAAPASAPARPIP